MKVLRVLLYPVRMLLEAWGYVVGDGTWWLRPYELRLIEASAERLSSENKLILKRQLSSHFYVQRLHDDKITHIAFHWRETIERMSLPDNYRLAKMKLTYGRRSATVSVETVNGLIYGLKYYTPPKPVVLEPFNIVEIEYGGEGDESITQSIDREEHGDDPK
jgi:hypothetical protein